MNTIKKYQTFLEESELLDLSNPKKLKFKWKRSEASKGKWSWLDDNKLRGYICSLNGAEIGGLYNVSRGTRSEDTSKQWYVNYTSKGSNNIILKKKFDFDDLAAAKKYFESAFVQILNSTEENESLFKMKTAILNLGRIKLKEITTT